MNHLEFIIYMHRRYSFLLLLLLPVVLPAQNRLSGLSLTVDAGLLVPNDKQAGFYSGRPTCPNTIERVLKSEQFGTQIWNNLVTQGAISPSAIHDYREFTIAEYPAMDYRLTYQLGVGIRYDYESRWGWLLHFDYSQVSATGRFQLSSHNGTGILGSRQYVTCDIYGLEKRILIDFAIARRVPFSELMELEIDLGVNFNNTKVQKEEMGVGGQSYSLLDVWGGRTPEMATGAYEYMNQGRMGWGGFCSVALCYNFAGSSVDAGYTMYHIQTRYTDYNDAAGGSFLNRWLASAALQHNVFLRFNINNFSFFGK